MFDSRLPHQETHAGLALWESTGTTSRPRWVRFPRPVPRHRDATGRRDRLRTDPPHAGLWVRLPPVVPTKTTKTHVHVAEWQTQRSQTPCPDGREGSTPSMDTEMNKRVTVAELAYATG